MAYRIKDPFPDEFDQRMYPILEDVPRPRLDPDLERILYNNDIDRTSKNSLPGDTVRWIRSNLPNEELLAFGLYLSVKMPILIEQEKSRHPWDPMPQPPEIVHTFLKMLIEKTDRKELKRRWADRYKGIMDRYHFLTYRILMRNIVCARMKQKFKDEQNGQLNQNTCQELSSLLLPADLRN